VTLKFVVPAKAGTQTEIAQRNRSSKDGDAHGPDSRLRGNDSDSEANFRQLANPVTIQ